MQCRMNDVIVNDIPKFLTVDPTENTHAIIFAGDDDVLIPCYLLNNSYIVKEM